MSSDYRRRTYGPRIIGQVELDLELAMVPESLRGIVVRVDHDVA